MSPTPAPPWPGRRAAGLLLFAGLCGLWHYQVLTADNHYDMCATLSRPWLAEPWNIGLPTAYAALDTALAAESAALALARHQADAGPLPVATMVATQQHLAEVVARRQAAQVAAGLTPTP